MSIQSAFSGGKSIARRGVAGALVAASLFASNAAQAGGFTEQECRLVDGVMRELVRAVGKDTLSVPFRQSYVNWRGANFTCDGPQIVATTENDVATWTTVRRILIAGDHPLSLQDRGVQPIWQPSAASLALNQPG